MNCTRLDEELSGYLDGELSRQRHLEVETHLRECPACARRLEEMRSLDSLKSLLEPPNPPKEKWRDCWEEIKKKTTASLSAERVKARVAKRRRAYLVRRALFALTVAVAALAVSSLLWMFLIS